jgi:acetyltransferase
MSIRNLDVLFKPRSIALIGASKVRGTVGAVLAHNLFNSGFTGPIIPVNPKHRAIEGVLTYPDAQALPEVPDLAVIATPPDTVPTLIDAFGERGTRAAVIITAGFGEGGDAAGGRLRRAMLEAAGRYTLRIVGPNCIGVMVPSIGLNAGFAHIAPKPGHLAFVAQSGAVATSVLDWATS